MGNDPSNGKLKQKRITLGYAKTRLEGMRMLADFNDSPYDLENCKKTFQEVYDDWSKDKFQSISKSNINGYQASFNSCASIHDRIFKDLKTNDLQYVIDHCGKNYPTLRKLKVLFKQLYDYAMKHDICSKDYSDYIDIVKHKDKNPNKRDRDRLSEDDIQKLWRSADNRYIQIILMLIYTGVRISELLDLKKSDVNLDKQYFNVVKSKTENGIRKVPIADKIMPFFEEWYNSSDCEYLVHTPDNEHFTYRNYYDSYWKPSIEVLNISSDTTPHFCRHTCISMLAEAKVEPTVIKTIVGHSGAMSLTESVYTHLDIQVLIDAVNLI
ncbi:MAG: site-specific integrase [Clostridium sp.]|nr:site-specific integrase [Clostridium sp.]